MEKGIFCWSIPLTTAFVSVHISKDMEWDENMKIEHILTDRSEEHLLNVCSHPIKNQLLTHKSTEVCVCVFVAHVSLNSKPFICQSVSSQ